MIEKNEYGFEEKEAKAFERLCVLVLDGSGSMSEPNPEAGLTKAESINQVVKDTILELQERPISKDLLITILTYDNKVDNNPVLPITPIENIDISQYNFNPMEMNGVIRGGQTAIGDALLCAYNITKDFVLDKNAEYPRSAVILLMSDGMNNCGEDPKAVSDQIHNEITQKELRNKIRRICALGFGDPNDKNSLDTDLLRSIVTEPKDGPEGNYLQSLNPDIIIEFFLKSFMR